MNKKFFSVILLGGLLSSSVAKCDMEDDMKASIALGLVTKFIVHTAVSSSSDLSHNKALTAAILIDLIGSAVTFNNHGTNKISGEAYIRRVIGTACVYAGLTKLYGIAAPGQGA